MYQVYFYQFDVSEYTSTIEDAHKIGRRKGWGYHVYKLGAQKMKNNTMQKLIDFIYGVVPIVLGGIGAYILFGVLVYIVWRI